MIFYFYCELQSIILKSMLSCCNDDFDSSPVPLHVLGVAGYSKYLSMPGCFPLERLTITK